MFVGHYGVSFATTKANAGIPLWILFLAVQWLDVIWAPLVLLGIEKVRIVPGFTATNPLDLYYMPYTHSLVAAILWSVAAAGAYRAVRGANAEASLFVGLAVLSHWILDFIVHVRDLPLYDNTQKVGLGLWNQPILAFTLEAALLLGAIAGYLRASHTRAMGILGFGLTMLAVQAYIFFGPPPASPAAAAGTALGAYGLFALVIWFLADRR
ncbi:MAG TPA: hypothetical protein VHI98_20970 [Vicinamibacterales bacterium]|jgi:hypothetical protein|nr:hypothetical protein [Vicinamibacterales bacterium]